MHPNCVWIEKKPFQKDLHEALGREVFCENDGNCFALSEAIDGSGKNYKIVYHLYIVFAKNRDELLKYCLKKGIEK